MSNIPDKNQLEIFFKDNANIFMLPIHIKCEKDLLNVLNTRWKIFLHLVEASPWLKNLSNNIRISIDEANKAFCKFYDGNINGAICALSNLINIAIIQSPSYIITSLKDFFGELGEEWNEWYRIRLNNLFPLSKQDMCHIPFSKRSIIKNQRYSINGIPCLYLGNSIYVCWEEMHRPNLDSISVSKFNVKRDINILNLSVTISDLLSPNINGDIFFYEQNVITFFNSWILQSLCSVIIDSDNRSFYAEYIIPQLLMQHLKERNIDGILYFSTRVDSVYFNNKSFICKNLAIPATDYSQSQDEDYSKKIREYFSWSSPVNVGLYDIGSSIMRNSNSSRKEVLNSARTGANISLDSVLNTTYRETVFFKFETILHQSNLYND